jgi:chromosome partitioning protein
MGSDFVKARTAHVIVVGNEKGGSGKSTTAMHIAVALMKSGQRVATIDLDCRQQSLTRLIDNRRAWAAHSETNLELPIHRCLRLGGQQQIAENEQIELSQLMSAISAVETICDVVVIDTPGHDSYLMRLAHSLADTLVTPINDSFLDLDVFAKFDPQTYQVVEESHYAELVRTARHSRRKFDGSTIDWIVMRNRLAPLRSRNKTRVAETLQALSEQLVFRPVDGFGERVVYRELVPRGLTAMDDLNEATLGIKPGQGHYTARAEVLAFLAQLRSPDERAVAPERSEVMAPPPGYQTVHSFSPPMF